MKKNEANHQSNRIQNNKNKSIPIKNNKMNCSKTEKNGNSRINSNAKTITHSASKTGVKKEQTSSNNLCETNVFNNVYALTEIESLSTDPTNSSGSKCLDLHRLDVHEEELNENMQIDENQNTNIKSDVKIEDENTAIEQDQNLSSNEKQDQPPTNAIIPDQIDFSSLQPLENSCDTDSECEKELKLFQKNGSIPDPSQQQRLIHYIQRQKVNAIVSNNFREASKLQTTFQNLITAINESQVHDTLKIRIDEIEKKILETTEKINEVNKETKSAISTERSNLNQKRDEILFNQETELDQFERKWNDEEFLRKFTKPSSTLITKQSIQHSYILIKDFDKAEKLQNEIESMEKLESKEAQNKAETEMQKEQKKLIDKHQNEIDFFNEFSKRQIDIVKNRNESKLEPLIARKRKLEIELSSLKKLKAGQINSPSLPSIQTTNSSSPSSRIGNKTPANGMRMCRANSALESAMTPRTIQRYSSYKTQIVNPKITLKPLGKVITKKDKKKLMSRNHVEKMRINNI